MKQTNEIHSKLDALIDWSNDYTIINDFKEGEILIFNNKDEFFFAGLLLTDVCKFAQSNNLNYYIDEIGIHIY